MEYQKNKYYEIAIVSDIGERKEMKMLTGLMYRKKMRQWLYATAWVDLKAVNLQAV